jgi:flavin-binding protein dodecin
MTHIAKIIEIVGRSDRSWENAAQVAVEEARKTIHGIHGIEVMDMTATVDESTGKISQYRTGIKVSFGVEH